MTQFFTVISFFSAFALLQGCISPKSASTSGPKTSGVVDYYVSPGITQYFLRPCRFTTTDKRYAIIDLTTRDTLGRLTSATLHASVYQPTRLQPTDSLWLQDADNKQVGVPVKLLFIEPKGSSVMSRIEATLPLGATLRLVQNSGQGMAIGTKANMWPLIPGKKAQKRMAALATYLTP